MSSKYTLLLTSWYFPIKILSWQDAVKMIYEQTVTVIAEYDEEIRSPSVTWKVPAVIVLKRKININKKKIKFSRPNIYARDRFCCQYCGQGPLPRRALTYDHLFSFHIL